MSQLDFDPRLSKKRFLIQISQLNSLIEVEESILHQENTGISLLLQALSQKRRIAMATEHEILLKFTKLAENHGYTKQIVSQRCFQSPGTFKRIRLVRHDNLTLTYRKGPFDLVTVDLDNI